MNGEAKTQKGICAVISKGPFSYILAGLKPVPATVVNSHWSGQRGEFLVLHHSESCDQLHYARAAGSPGCRGRSLDGLAPLAQGLWPRFMGQTPARTLAWLLASGSRWSAVAVGQMIYRYNRLNA